MIQCVYKQNKGGGEMTVKEISEKCNCSKSWVYALRKKLGRLPTVEEIMERKGKVGAPIKYETKEQ